jgi:type I restriction enzyme R subunit
MMLSKLTESAIEDFAIKLLERLGYSYVYAPDIAPMASTRNAGITVRCC